MPDITLTTTSTLSDGSLTLTVYEDAGGDGTGSSTDPNGKPYDNSATVSLTGGTDETNTLSGFGATGESAYWLTADYSSPSVESDPPTLSAATASAPISTGTPVDLLATGSATGTGTAPLTRRRTTAASGSAAGIGTATTVRQRDVTATGVAIGTAPAPTVVRTRHVNATGVGQVTGGGMLVFRRGLAATGTGTGIGHALLTERTTAEVLISATGNASGAGAATTTRRRNVGAAGTATATGVGTLHLTRGLAATGDGALNGSDNTLRRLRRLDATGAAAGVGTALPSANLILSASGSADGSGAASTTRRRGVGATGTATGVGAAGLLQARPDSVVQVTALDGEVIFTEEMTVPLSTDPETGSE